MFESQITLLDESTLVCASGSTCAALDANSRESLAEHIRFLLATDELTALTDCTTAARTLVIAGVERKLRLNFHPVSDAEMSSVKRIVQVECDSADALRVAEQRLLQSDRMASIGQLAAGVAHEINNPLAFVLSNFSTLAQYVDDMLRVIRAFERRDTHCSPNDDVAATKARVSYDALVEDLPLLLTETREGIERVRKIVQDLKDFSRAGSGDCWADADLNRELDSTLNIAWNDLKYKCVVQRDYGDLPSVKCVPSQLNQVFLNILVNAGHAIDANGTIRLTTRREGDDVVVEIADTGKGIPSEHLGKIFEPFFTTKPVGQGTGLGLSLSHGIVQRHGGRIDVTSEIGVGTTFRIVLPLRRERQAAR